MLRWGRKSLPRQFSISSPILLINNRAIFSREEILAQFKYALLQRPQSAMLLTHDTAQMFLLR